MLLLRDLKGAQISILVALLRANRPLTKTELSDETGYDNETTTRGIKLLARRDLVLILPNGRHPTVTLAANCPQLLFPEILTAKKSQSEASSSSIYIHTDSKNLLLLEDPTAKKSQSARQISQSPLYTANIAALDAAGIRSPARERLADLQHVTPALITAHAATSPNLALAIYRIENNWPAPPTNNNNDSNRYISGEFADYILH